MAGETHSPKAMLIFRGVALAPHLNTGFKHLEDFSHPYPSFHAALKKRNSYVNFGETPAYQQTLPKNLFKISHET